MRSLIRNIVLFIVILIFLIPVSFIFTLVLIPLWRWIEYSFGIESIGHSGPAEWCFMSVFLVFIISCTIIYRISRKNTSADNRLNR